MTKRVLVTSEGSIQGIVNPGEEWEVFPGTDERPAGAKWFDAPDDVTNDWYICLLYTSPSPRDQRGSRMPSSA